MNALLGSLLVFATFVTLCNAQCRVIPSEGAVGASPSECRDSDGATHPLKAEWNTGDCEKCSCEENGIHCCSIVLKPAKYDESKCEKIFHQETCSFTVVEKENPAKTCVVNGWTM
uniref:Beta-microseminoprotein n=1 Tax=Propithecus coquereli TaxID=379532 RepID=A0A2K6F4U2_PROCO